MVSHDPCFHFLPILAIYPALEIAGHQVSSPQKYCYNASAERGNFCE